MQTLICIPRNFKTKDCNRFANSGRMAYREKLLQVMNVFCALCWKWFFIRLDFDFVFNFTFTAIDFTLETNDVCEIQHRQISIMSDRSTDYCFTIDSAVELH